MTPALSVAVCAFNDPHRLALCLEGLALQAGTDTEVVVVNDGGVPLDVVLAPFASRLTLLADQLDPLSCAYRLAAARNQASRISRANRILFLDQDCVAGPGVLAAHAAYDDATVAVAGVRRHLAEDAVAALRPEDVPGLADRTLATDYRMQLCGFREASGQILPMEASWATGCHLSVPTTMLRRIGGYWEAFVGWGCEDLEMALRLGRAGCSLTVRTDLAVIHLDHPKRSQSVSFRRNQGLLARTQRDPRIIYRGPASARTVPRKSVPSITVPTPDPTSSEVG